MPKRDAFALQSNIEKKLRLARIKKDAFVLPSDTGRNLGVTDTYREAERYKHMHTRIYTNIYLASTVVIEG